MKFWVIEKPSISDVRRKSSELRNVKHTCEKRELRRGVPVRKGKAIGGRLLHAGVERQRRRTTTSKAVSKGKCLGNPSRQTLIT